MIISKILHNRNELLVPIGLFAFGIVSRLPLIEKMQSHWDGPQYSIALVNYSFIQQTPALPGYPIYIGIGMLFNFFLVNPHLSILMISVLYSGVGSVIFYIAGKELFNKKTGIISSLLFISSPVFYFFGITANPYGAVGVNSVLLALATFLLVKGKLRSGIVYGLIFSYCIGFRPQDLFFLTPLAVFGFIYLSNKERVYLLISFLFSSLFWMVPVGNTVGGLPIYIELLLHDYLAGNRGNVISHALSIPPIIIKGLFLTLGISPFLYIFAIKKKSLKKLFKKVETKIFLLWIAPALLFNIFVRSDHAAHQVNYLASLIVLTALITVYLFGKKKRILFLITLTFILFNLYTFFRDRDSGHVAEYIPQSYHYSEIKKNDILLSGKVDFIKGQFNSENTIIVTTSLLWRPLMYHLKDYQVIDLEALYTTNNDYKYAVRVGKSWKFKEYINKSLTYQVPANIRNVVLVDEGSSAWTNAKKKQVLLKPYGQLSVIAVMPGEKIIYSKNEFKITKNK